MGWIATDEMPGSDWQRWRTANPNSPEYNLRVTFCVNYELVNAGARPKVDLGSRQNAALAERALWLLTEELRRSDEHRVSSARIGSSQALFLRDAQRYLYGLQGLAWLRKHIEDKYHAPKFIAEHASGTAIDVTYNVGKGVAIFSSALVETVIGTSPGWGRSGKGLPASAPGGDAWFELGAAHYAASHPAAGPEHPFNLLLMVVPAF